MALLSRGFTVRIEQRDDQLTLLRTRNHTEWLDRWRRQGALHKPIQLGRCSPPRRRMFCPCHSTAPQTHPARSCLLASTHTNICQHKALHRSISQLITHIQHTLEWQFQAGRRSKPASQAAKQAARQTSQLGQAGQSLAARHPDTDN